MNQRANENDKLDRLFLDYFKNNINIPKSTQDIINKILTDIKNNNINKNI